MKKKWAQKHHELLQLMLTLDMSKSTILRIIDKVNELLSEPEACIAKTDQFINLLQSCKTEEEVILKLDQVRL